VRAANPSGGMFAPIDVKVPSVVLVQILGVTTQAFTVSRVVSVIK
jgi:hypothetical protein